MAARADSLRPAARSPRAAGTTASSAGKAHRRSPTACPAAASLETPASCQQTGHQAAKCRVSVQALDLVTWPATGYLGLMHPAQRSEAGAPLGSGQRAGDDQEAVWLEPRSPRVRHRGGGQAAAWRWLGHPSSADRVAVFTRDTRRLVILLQQPRTEVDRTIWPSTQHFEVPAGQLDNGGRLVGSDPGRIPAGMAGQGSRTS